MKVLQHTPMFAMRRAVHLLVIVNFLVQNSFCAVLDFGDVLVQKAGPNVTLTVNNASSTRSTSYTINPPQPPFSHVSGSLSGSIPPSGSTVITFGFQAPDSASADQMFQQISQLTWYSQNGNPNTINNLLRANMLVPKPFNVTKTKANWFTTEGARKSNRFATYVRWKSSTGNIADLSLIEVREVVTNQQVLPASGTRNLAEYPNGCQSSDVPYVLLPPPWYTESTKEFTLPFPNIITGLINSELTVPLWNEQLIIDGHGTEKVKLPIAAELSGASYWIEQAYQWTAPWMRDASGCQIWTTMLTDVVTKQILFVNGRWVCRITSKEAGTAPDFDMANVSIASAPKTGTPTSVSDITVKWFASGSVLQWSGTPHGPWNDVLESPSLTEMTFSSDDGAPSKFFRIKF